MTTDDGASRRQRRGKTPNPTATSSCDATDLIDTSDCLDHAEKGSSSPSDTALIKSAIAEGDDDASSFSSSSSAVLTVNLRHLASATLVTLLLSHLVLRFTCLTAALYRDPTHQTFTTWRITSHKASIRLNVYANSHPVGWLHEHDEILVFGDDAGRPYDTDGMPYHWNETEPSARMHVVRPKNGWITSVTKHGHAQVERIHHRHGPFGSSRANNGRFVAAASNVDSRFCPIFNAGRIHPTVSRYNYAPTALVVGQALWNASQVLHLFQLLCLITMAAFGKNHNHSRQSSTTTTTTQWQRWTLGGTCLATVALLPFAAYVTSTGGYAFAVLALGCALVPLLGTSSSPHELRVCIVDEKPNDSSPVPVAPKRFTLSLDHERHGRNERRVFSMKRLCKVELIALLANVGCTMYNYESSRDVWPHWNALYRSLDQRFGWDGGSDFDSLEDVLVRSTYTLGFDGHVPLFVPSASGSTTGHLVFLALWSLLPFLYVFYFGALYMMSRKTPSSTVQRFLCGFAMFHFVFLTDVVEYKFGRGFKNPWGEWAHWSERLAWRIAILIPIYQNVATGHWKHGCTKRPAVGRAIHYVMLLCGVVFFVNQILVEDTIHFLQFVLGQKETGAIGLSHIYHRVLVTMVAVYAFMCFGGSSCHHIYVGWDDEDDEEPAATNEKKKRPKIVTYLPRVFQRILYSKRLFHRPSSNE